MGKRKQKEEEKKEKPIFGSGAEPLPEPEDDGLVKCVCKVPCSWRGYHDEGDRVFVERKLLEGDPFFKSHFKPLEPLASVEAAGADVNKSGGTDNAGDEGDNAGGGTDNADGGGTDNAGGGTDNADGGETDTGGENGQGELGLK